ncbi:uncharacterized protein LOC126899218 [Daktulosphaira vitifoliae]|uniref:uncharacterized protein LOC126899218 n=1 Tax=Daktulosphaira vitifoliae TaxID=58002 RepID=UPI0021AA806E|nr:uncharacterized protein LOC126899218 [Daktulosphaira vitifoliae]
MSVAAVGFALLITSVFSFAFFYLMKYAFHTSSNSLSKPIRSTKKRTTNSVVTKHVSRGNNKPTTLKIKKLTETKRNIQKADRKLKQQTINSKTKSTKLALVTTQELLHKENDELKILKQSQPLKIVKEKVDNQELMNTFIKSNTFLTKSIVSNNVPEIKQKSLNKMPLVEKSNDTVSRKIKLSELNQKKNNNDFLTQAKQKSKASSFKISDFDFEHFDFDDGSLLITKLIEKCDLSREQTQYVLDTLLNKQQSVNMKSGSMTTEWVKPSDSSEKKLKKKLQENEIQLKHLEEQLAGANKKTGEYRAELNTHISRIRLLENKFNELQAVRSYEAKEKSTIIAELAKYKNNLTSIEEQLKKSKSTLSLHQQQSLDILTEKDKQIKELQIQLLEVQECLADKIKISSVVPNSTSVAENVCNGNLKNTVIERPAVEGQEYIPGEPDILNNGVIVNSIEFETVKKENYFLKSRCDDLEKKLVNKEKQIKEYSNEVNELNKNVVDLDKKYQEEIKLLRVEKKSYEEKNHELRAKNFKVLEALKQTERALEAKIKSEQDRKLRDDSKYSFKRARQLLRRQLLPQDSDSDESSDKETMNDEDDEKWSQAFAKKVLRYYENQQKSIKMKHVVNNQQSLDQQNRHDIVLSLEQQNDKLHRMVTHYKSIISDTETMLSQLHKHVENEESRWCDQLLELQQQLDKANAELQRRKDEESSLNTTMNSSISSL